MHTVHISMMYVESTYYLQTDRQMMPLTHTLTHRHKLVIEQEVERERERETLTVVLSGSVFPCEDPLASDTIFCPALTMATMNNTFSHKLQCIMYNTQ